MFGKILRAGKGSHGVKYKIEVYITQLENLPTSIRKCRVIWARAAKVQMTEFKDVRGSVASFKQNLVQVTTMYRDKSGKVDSKEYEFKVQLPGKSSSDPTITVGKATLDMANFCTDHNNTQTVQLPVTFKLGGSTTGYLKMNITTVFLGDSNEDGMTEVSGMTGLTSDHGSVREQDLDGFADEESKFGKKKNKKTDAAAGKSSGATPLESKSRNRRPLPPTAEEDGSDVDEGPLEASPAPAPKAGRKKSPYDDDDDEGDDNPFAKKVAAKAPPKKPVPPPKAKVWDDDEDISPIESDDGSDSELKAKLRKKEPDESLDDMKSDLFGAKKKAPAGGAGPSTSRAPAAGSSTKSGKGGHPPPIAEEDEDSLRNDLFAAKPKAAPAKAPAKGAAKAAAAVEEDEDALRGDLFSAKPKAAPKAAAKPAAKPAPVEEEDEEALRGDLFSAKPKAAPKAAAAKGAAKPAAVDEDEDALRGDLFSAKTKAAPKAAAKPAAKPAPMEEEDEDALRGDLFSAKTKAAPAKASAAGSKAAKPKAAEPEDDYDDGYGYGASTSAAAPLASSKSRGRSGEIQPEMSTKSSGGGSAKAGSGKLESAKSGGGALGDVAQLQKRIAQLEGELADERAAKEDISKKLKKNTDRIADLEDQLAEGDLTELYAQMRDMESKYQNEIKELMDRHLSEVAELEERHKQELEEARQAGGSARAGPSEEELEELEELKSDLRRQEASLRARTSKLEADQAAAQAAKQSAEAKLAEANKMIDDSLLVATKHQQENKELQEEVARLKRRLEDVSAWDTGAAVAAVTAASARDVRGASEDDEELEELREKVEELQEENARLQKLVSTRGRGSRPASDTEETYKKRVEELEATHRKLEAVCDDLEDKSLRAQERADKLQAELTAANDRIRGLEGALAAAKRLEEEGAGGGARGGKGSAGELEARAAKLAREKASLEEQLEEERAARQELEDLMKDRLDRSGDDEAADTVAAFEVKYNRLKDKYKLLEETSQEDIDDLTEALNEAQAKIDELQRTVKQLQAQLAQNNSRGAGAAGPGAFGGPGGGGAGSEELRRLRAENEQVVAQLVSKTMELAELSEREITTRRELTRLKEVNMKLAQKATTLEAQAAMASQVSSAAPSPNGSKPAKGKK